jgi:hypothetical protein
MIDILLNKVKTWSHEKMMEYTNNIPLPDLPQRNHFIQEKIFDGIIIYSNRSLRYIGDNGVVIAITETTDTSCYDTLCKLYGSSFRTVQPINHSFIDGFEIVELKNEFNEPGIPGNAEIQENNFNDEYFLKFVINVSKMIHELDKVGSKYPNFINPYKFVRDSKGYFFNPYINNLDELSFVHSKEEFLDNQHKQLGYLLFAFKESMNIDFDSVLIKKKAKELWQK